MTYGLKTQFSGIKIALVYRQSIFQFEWLIATLLLSNTEQKFYCDFLQLGDWNIFSSSPFFFICKELVEQV